MKKNITINLFGSLYAIDEDACEVLEQYLQNMKRYFGHRDGGDEIADDIEHRVAELFAELKAQGVEAISVEHVRDIVRRIGNPEEMDGEASDAGSTDETASPEPESAPTAASRLRSWFAARRLFRDTEDKVLGGVMSGLCQFFGGTDPLPWRIIVVILTFFSFSTVGILYLAAWALMPAAVTAEDRLQMKGRPVNPQTLNEELMRGASRAGEYLRSENFRTTTRGFLGTLFHLILWCLKLVGLFFFGTFILVFVVLIGMVLFGTIGGVGQLVNSGLIEYATGEVLRQAPTLLWEFWGILLSGLLLLSILFYALVRSLLRRPTDPPMRTATRTTLIVLCVLSLAACITLGIFTILHYQRAERMMNTQQGVYMPARERQEIADSGWEIKQAEGCNEEGDFTGWTDDFNDDASQQCLVFRRNKGVGQWAFTAVRMEELPEGDYHLEALVYTNGSGAKIFREASGKRVFTAVPPVDLNGKGNIAYMDLAALDSIALIPRTPDYIARLAKVRKEADDWSWVRGETFHHPGGVIVYGFTGDMRMPAKKATLYRMAAVSENRVAVPLSAAPGDSLAQKTPAEAAKR